MLDAACPGNVFAAPPMEYVLECTKLMNSKKGVLHLINNYTGDRAAWDMARELAEAEDIKIGVVLINDDVAVMNSAYTVGRRGVAGNFFVIKACGAAAAEGASLEELVKLGEKVVGVVRTMGVAISGCTPPGKDKPIFELADGEMEMGVGIHGEKGRRREKLPKADAVVDELFDAVSKDLPFEKGDEVALMINGLGGTPPSELYVLYRRAALRSKDAGYNVVRNYVGDYCTSLEMAGFSLTFIRLDDELIACSKRRPKSPCASSSPRSSRRTTNASSLAKGNSTTGVSGPVWRRGVQYRERSHHGGRFRRRRRSQIPGNHSGLRQDRQNVGSQTATTDVRRDGLAAPGAGNPASRPLSGC